MRLSGLLPLISSIPELAELRTRLGVAGRCLAGVMDAAKPALVAALLEGEGAPALIVTPRPERATAMLEELSLYLSRPERLLLFPELDLIPYERISPDIEASDARLAVLQRLAAADGTPAIVVTSGLALAQGTLAPAERSAAVIELHRGLRQPRAELLRRLAEIGYETAALVEARGQVSHRGGIVDVFPPGASLPLRIELFGDEIESLRTFDPATQRTVEALEVASIDPAREASAQQSEVTRLLDSLNLEPLNDENRERAEDDARRLREGDLSAGNGFYLPFLARASLLDYFPRHVVVVVDEAADLGHALDELDTQAIEARTDLERRGSIPHGLPLPHADRRELEQRLAATERRLDLHRWATDEDSAALRLPFDAPAAFGGRLRPAMHGVLDVVRAAGRAVVTSQQSLRLAELFQSEGMASAVTEEVMQPPAPGQLRLVHGSVGAGWTLPLPEGSLHLLTDAEIFGFTKQRRTTHARGRNRDAFLADLSPGDFVVHVEHGIGLFEGLVRRSVAGVEREYLDVRYAEGDRLLVPTDQVDRVSRFVGPSDRTPSPTRLGTGEWARAKDRVRRAVTDLAQELLTLYAARELLQGHAFSPDQPWQLELEASFPYVETSDQLRAIFDVKADMESPRPMDRVIVGDVGYGKTEVAIRAAFKAVLDGMQVAVLVPTTVLAQQHLQTFRERLSGFPTRLDVLSRFRSDREAEQVMAAAAAGDIDILIGTHRLLQKGLTFKNLGLVIIDEEQRFGVTHKERLKQMRQQVDVLTLSATPIPRTLHMSLSGIRDMSTMTTAPEDRQPIKTFVAEFDERLVREAILRELDRGGQVYFVHNRVHNIARIADELRRIVPEAEIAVGHGQMPEDELEHVMADFQRGQYDVLVCTTIIESGLDIPSVNTILINQADRLGLSQLYQLRGRVGRGASRAFAYLLYDKLRALTETAQKRLQTIFEATELGAGFQIALRDLEIRGAGNLLGSEQSGHIGAVGFDLYSRMLGDAVARLRAASKGEQPPVPATSLPALQIDLPLTAFIPESYVPELNLRLALYQRMGQIGGPADAAALSEELGDRFGVPPPAVANLLFVLALKGLARVAGLASIVRENGELVVRGSEALPRREQVRQRFAPAVTVGTTQVRIPEGSNWPELLYRVVAELADQETGSLPSLATMGLPDGGKPVERPAAAEPAWPRPARPTPNGAAPPGFPQRVQRLPPAEASRPRRRRRGRQ